MTILLCTLQRVSSQIVIINLALIEGITITFYVDMLKIEKKAIFLKST